MRVRWLSVVFTLLMGAALTSPDIATAQVILNEVMPAPTAGDEWVELKNTSAGEVALSDWQVEDNTGLLSPLPGFASLSIPAGGYFVFELKNRLNNAGDILILRRPDLSIADSVQYNSSVSDQSWSRVTDTLNTFVLAQPSRGFANLVSTPSATPVASSPTPLPSSSPPSPSPSLLPTASPWVSPLPTSPAPSASPLPAASYPLQLSEVQACPQTGELEWVEFFNPNTISVTVSGWKLKDSSGNSRSLNLSIAARSFASVEFTSALLNNDGDTLFVLDQYGNPLLEVQLSECQKGESFVYLSGSWQRTTTPTKNTLNVFSNPEIEEESSLLSQNLDPFTTEAMPSTPSGTFLTSPLRSDFQQLSLSSLTDAVTGTLSASSSIESTPAVASPAPEPSSLTPELTSSALPFYFDGYFILGLFISSVMAVGVGGFGVYQWYTERRATEALETF